MWHSAHPEVQTVAERVGLEHREHGARWMRSFTCSRLVTIVKVIITSSDHELHLPMRTAAQAPIWFG